MFDRCEITESGGEGAYDPATASYGPATGTTVWSGPCRLTAARAGTNEALAGEAVVTTGHWQLHIPVLGTEAVQSGHRARMVASAGDPALVGALFTIQDPAQASATSARRLEVERAV